MLKESELTIIQEKDKKDETINQMKEQIGIVLQAAEKLEEDVQKKDE